MKHSAKRTTALALALLMLLSAFASCSESEVNEETTAGEQTPTVSADPEAALTEEETVEDDGKAAYAPELPNGSTKAMHSVSFPVTMICTPIPFTPATCTPKK